MKEYEYKTTINTESYPTLKEYVDELGDDLDVEIFGTVIPAEPEVGYIHPTAEDFEVRIEGTQKWITELLTKEDSESLQDEFVEDFLDNLKP